jgi:hypothetical protein
MPERTAERSVAGLAHRGEVRARKARTFPAALGRASGPETNENYRVC